MFSLIAWFVVILVLAGLALYLLRELSPDPTITKFGRLFIIVFAILALLYLFLGATNLAGDLRFR
jgi:hypothetical protein